MGKNILLSVWMSVYNMKSFLKEALESVLYQKTNFEYEIIIFDDASTDGSTDIVRDYKKKYPDRIVILIQEENTYGRKDFTKYVSDLCMRHSKGKYIAFCEGDDYWTDPYKLQKQVDYMETHLECMLTMHNAFLWDYRDNSRILMQREENGEISAEELILQKKGIWPAASMVFRKECEDMPDFFFDCGIGDWNRQLHALTMGNVYYFGKPMSVYRYMHTTSWSKNMQEDYAKRWVHNYKMIAFIKKYNEYTKQQYQLLLQERIQRFYFDSVDIFRNSDGTLYESQIEEEQYQEYMTDIINLKKSFFEEDFISEKLRLFCKQFERIFLIGTGHFAEVLTGQMKANHIDFNGYAVSNDQIKLDEFQGKTVQYLREMKNCTNTGFVIAINPVNWSSLYKSLKDNNIENWYCPYLISMS